MGDYTQMAAPRVPLRHRGLRELPGIRHRRRGGVPAGVLARRPRPVRRMAPGHLGGEDPLRPHGEDRRHHRPREPPVPRGLHPRRNVQALRAVREQRALPHPLRHAGVPRRGHRHREGDHRLQLDPRARGVRGHDEGGGIRELEADPRGCPQGEPAAHGPPPRHRPRVREEMPQGPARLYRGGPRPHRHELLEGQDARVPGHPRSSDAAGHALGGAA